MDSVRTWADVRDAARAYYLLLTRKPIVGEYYNIGGTTTKTVKEMLDYLISLSPMKNLIKIVVDSNRLRPIDADLQVPDTSKFNQHTGWVPEISFEETMEDLLNYWRNKIKSGRKFLIR